MLWNFLVYFNSWNRKGTSSLLIYIIIRIPIRINGYIYKNTIIKLKKWMEEHNNINFPTESVRV